MARALALPLGYSGKLGSVARLEVAWVQAGEAVEGGGPSQRAAPLGSAVGGVERHPGRLHPEDLGRGVGVALSEPQQRAEPGGGVGVGVPLGERVTFEPVRHAGLGGLGRLLLLGGLMVEFGEGVGQLGFVPLPVLVVVAALQLPEGAGAGAVAGLVAALAAAGAHEGAALAPGEPGATPLARVLPGGHGRAGSPIPGRATWAGRWVARLAPGALAASTA